MIMTTTFTVTLKIKVTHSKDTFIDTNSLKGLIGNGVGTIRSLGSDYLCEVAEKFETTPEMATVELTSLKEGKTSIDIDDFENYVI